LPSTVIVQVSLDVGYAILATSSLSFLGLGAQPPSPEWGAIIAEGRSYIQTAWWWSTFAGLALALTVLGVPGEVSDAGMPEMIVSGVPGVPGV